MNDGKPLFSMSHPKATVKTRAMLSLDRKRKERRQKYLDTPRCWPAVAREALETITLEGLESA